MPDLWSDDIGLLVKGPKAPVVILREQASLLGRKTQNLVEAQVYRNTSKDSLSSIQAQDFIYSFCLVAPPLSSYRYHLFTISHGVWFYPISISGSDEIMAEIADSLPQCSLSSKASILAKCEAEFLDILKALFGATRTKNILLALLAQMNSPE